MLSRRETIMVIAASLVVAVFGLDRWVVGPLLERREALRAEEVELRRERMFADRVLRREGAAARRWEQLASGPLLDAASAAESAILHAVRDWSRQARLDLSAVQPDRPEGNGDLREVVLRVNGSGTIEAVARFLYQLERSDLPVRIDRLRVATAAGGSGGSLSIDVRLSTLYRVERDETPRGAEGGRS